MTLNQTQPALSENDLRRKIVEILGDLWDRGHVNTTGVSISARLPDGNILVDQTGTGFRKCRVTEDDLLVIDLDGNVVRLAPKTSEKLAPVNTAIHLACYRDNPLVMACIHAHAPYSQVFACVGKDIEPFTLQSKILGTVPCMRIDDGEYKRKFAADAPDITVPTGLHGRPDVYYVMREVARQTADAMKPRAQELEKHGLAVTHYQHGLFVFARNLDEAFDNLERVEANARAQLLAKALAV